MTDRKLSPDEVEQLGLERKLPANEAQDLGLEPKEPSFWEKAAQSLPDFSPRGRAGAALRGFGQGEGYGFLDELRGLQGGADAIQGEMGIPGHHVDVVRHEGEPLLDFAKRGYASERDAARKEDTEADAAHPGYFRGAQVAGALASPSPTGKGALARLAFGGLQGTAAGLGGSDAQDASENAKDAATGGALGIAGAGLGEGVGAARGIFKKGIDRARGIINDKNEAALEKAIASQKGKLGSAVQSGSRDLEVLGREAPHVGMPLARDLNHFMASPEAEGLINQVVAGKLESAPGRLDQIANEKAALAQLLANKGSDLASANAAAEQTPVVMPRLKRYAGRFIGAGAGAAVGAELAGPEHRGTGAAFGSMLGTALLGKPGTSFGNMVNNPAFAVKAGKAGVAASNALGRLPIAASEAMAQDQGHPPPELDDEKRRALMDYLDSLGR